MNTLNLTTEQIEYLLSPKAIRDSAKRVYDYAQAGKSFFRINADKLPSTTKYVLEVINKNYPDLKIPFHSRWGHFRVGGVDRTKALDYKLAELNTAERARIKLDLVIPSVLLDAGAGAAWSYNESQTERTYSRSEGLGVASFHMFLAGVFAGDKRSLRTDAKGLKSVTVEDLKNYFQVNEGNPLLGVEGRVQLLNNLADALQNKVIFKDQRPGNILDYLISRYGETIPATGVLRAVLDGLGPIWPGRLSAQGINLGDIWKHSQLSSKELDSLVAIHKLSQWMTYSLIEPIMEAGVQVTGVENLTGLAEYRNGGLLIDSGLLEMKDPKNLEQKWAPDSDLVIEWRALTVYFLDLIGAEVQKALNKTPADFPLAKVLEGGTWWAGRFIAKGKRANGDPPLQIKSDGTVF
jgi:hypothetical protein